MPPSRLPFLCFLVFNPQDFLLSYLLSIHCQESCEKSVQLVEREPLHFRERVSSLEATTLLHFLEQLKFGFLINIRIE